jgi:hypothetical protein
MVLLVYLFVTTAILALTNEQKGRSVTCLVACLIIGLLCPLGQARRDHALYPFDHWGMYATDAFTGIFQEYIVETDRGLFYHYPFVKVSFSSPRAFMAIFPRLVTRCGCNSNDSTIDALINVLAKVVADEGDRPVRVFRMYDVNPLTGERILRYTWTARRIAFSCRLGEPCGPKASAT